MIIDAHIHVGAWNHTDFLGRAIDLAGTLGALTTAGVSGAVLMPTDQHAHDVLRDDIKRTVAGGYAGALWLFPWMRPVGQGEPGAADIAWVRAHRKDIAGLKFHPSLSRRRLTDEAFRPALELAEELGLVVLPHCGRWTEIAGYAHALEAAERHPNVRFLLAHAGGDTPPNAFGAAEAVRARGITNVWFEFSGLREYWVVERAVALIGADRYLLGSDFPLAHPLMYIGAVRAMALTDRERAMILGGNARALLGAPVAKE